MGPGRAVHILEGRLWKSEDWFRAGAGACVCQQGAEHACINHHEGRTTPGAPFEIRAVFPWLVPGTPKEPAPEKSSSDLSSRSRKPEPESCRTGAPLPAGMTRPSLECWSLGSWRVDLVALVLL